MTSTLSYELADTLNEKFAAYLKEHARIGYSITPEIFPDGLAEANVHLWYHHRTGEDDHRSLCSDPNPQRISRLTLSEANLLGALVQQVADELSDTQVALESLKEGQYTYRFRQ